MTKETYAKGELKEKAQKLGWIEKGVLAMNYFPTLSKNIAVKKLKEILKSRLEEDYEHWFGQTSKFNASYFHYSKEQKALIDGLMKASLIQKLDGYLNELEKKKVSKRTFASLLYPALVPEVAARRMDLVLERNHKALWKVYLDENELNSATLNLKQCYKIAQILKSKQAVDWVKDRANIRFTKETPKEGEPEEKEKSYLKKEVIFFLVKSNNYNQARYQFNKLLDSKRGLTEKVFPTEADKKKKYLSQSQVDCLIQEFPELQTLCSQ